MGELTYLDNRAKMFHAERDPTLRAYCELELFGETEQGLSPEQISRLLDTTEDEIQHDLARTYGLALLQANVVYVRCARALIDGELQKESIE